MEGQIESADPPFNTIHYNIKEVLSLFFPRPTKQHGRVLLITSDVIRFKIKFIRRHSTKRLTS